MIDWEWVSHGFFFSFGTLGALIVLILILLVLAGIGEVLTK